MPNWIYWAAAIAVADVLLVLFMRGAHLKPDPEEMRQERALSWKDEHSFTD